MYIKVMHVPVLKKNSCNRTKGGGKNVIVMYTCQDNLIPLLYVQWENKIKKKKREFPSWRSG